MKDFKKFCLHRKNILKNNLVYILIDFNAILKNDELDYHSNC